MDNVESAAAAGDSYPTTRVLTADGVVSLVGCLMGNPFINAVYIGHPGWKSMGGGSVTRRRPAHGDRARVVRDHRARVVADSVVAISPILLYIGMLIGAQAFQESPKSHAPPSCSR
jgi:AGZA family xanthine/uracil permease-like MFS transporter